MNPLAAADALVLCKSFENVHCRHEQCCRCKQVLLQVVHRTCMCLCRWRFRVHVMGDHVVAVALGPPEDVVDAWGVLHYPCCHRLNCVRVLSSLPMVMHFHLCSKQSLHVCALVFWGLWHGLPGTALLPALQHQHELATAPQACMSGHKAC